MYHYEYLNDTEFLQELTKNKIKQQYVKIIVLDWKENIIDQITGRAIGGSINVDADSAMRRTASIQLIADNVINNLTKIDNLISLNKKVIIEIGIKNDTNKYLQYPIFWFPQGYFIIIGASIDHSSEGTKINLTLHDKMALLNGECGGTIPAPVNFSEMEDQDEFGNILITNPTISSIIRELLVHFGNEQERNLIINDLDGPARQVVRWCGEDQLSLNYFFIDAQKMINQKEIYNSLKSLNSQVKPTTQEDEFYEQLLQKLIQKALKNTPQYNVETFPNSKTIVKYFLETATTKDIQKLKNIIKHLEKISKNSENLLTNLNNEKTTLKNTLTTIENQITTTPTEFKQALDNLCNKTILNFYKKYWKDAYNNGFWYPNNITKDKEFRDPIPKRCGRINWLKPEHRNKKDIDTLTNKLKLLKQRVNYVKNKIGTFVNEHFQGTYDEWINGTPKKNNNNYYIFGRMGVSYLLDLSLPINKKYYENINYNVKDFKSYMQTNNPYYFYNQDKNMGIFIRSNNANVNNGRKIVFGTVNYNIKNGTNKSKVSLHTTNRDITQLEWNEAGRKAKSTNKIFAESGSAWWLSQIIFSDKIAQIKKESKNNNQLIQQINDLCSYRVLKQIKECLNYFETQGFEYKLVNELSNSFNSPTTAILSTNGAKNLCDNIINFVDYMSFNLDSIKQDYDYNIKTYNYMRIIALNNKNFQNFNKINQSEKITFAKRLDQELTNLKELANKLPRDLKTELSLPGYFYFTPLRRDTEGNIIEYQRHSKTFNLKNFRDIGKYIVDNSGVFTEIQNKNINGEKPRIHIKNNNICSISQMAEGIITKLKNYKFQDNNMTYEQIMNDIEHIISYYNPNEEFYPNKLQYPYWSPIAMYKKYFYPLLKNAIKVQSDETKKERKLLKQQKEIIDKRLQQISKDEQTIPVACNNVLKKWCRKELPTYTKITEKLTTKANDKTRLQALQQQSNLLQKYYNNGNNLAHNISIISKHLNTIENSKNYSNLIQSSLKLDPNIFQTIQNQQLQKMNNIKKYIQDNRQMITAEKQYKKDLQKLTEELNKNLVQTSINEKEIIRLENEIASIEEEKNKNSASNAKASISELNSEISARKQDLKILLEKIKKEKIKLLKNFFKNGNKSHFFASFGKAAYEKDLLKKQEERQWYSIFKIDQIDKLTKENLQTICNTLLNNNFQSTFYFNLFYKLCIPAFKYGVKQFQYGEDVGYTLTDFTYPGELSCGAGDTIVSVLDKIKNALGNYEYYYDINGKFIFQEIRNYLNNSYSTSLSKQILNSKDFIFNYFSNSPIIYDFSNGEIIQSYQNTPQYQQIKNDFIIWGERETTTGQKVPIRYHLAIDSPPSVNKCYFLDAPKDKLEIYQYKIDMPVRPTKIKNQYKIVYIQEENACYEWIEENGYTGYKKIDYFLNNLNVIKKFGHFPFDTKNKGKQNQVYLNQDTGLLYKYNNKKNKYERIFTYRLQVCDGLKPAQGIIGRYYYSNDKEKIYVCSGPKNTDFQELKNVNSLQTINCIGTAFYLEGYLAETNGSISNDYYSELKTEWPKIWDLLNNKYFSDIEQKKLTSINYFLNLINSTDSINKFNISTIGKRSHIISNNSINCIFQPLCPEIIFFDNNPPVEENQTFSKQTLQRQNYENKTKIQKNNDLKKFNNNNSSNYIGLFIDHSIFQYLKLGGIVRSAYEEIRSELYQFITYNEQISIGLLPVYYLKPNAIIKLKNEQAGINGNFLIKNFSIPLNINSNMSLNCTKVISRI